MEGGKGGLSCSSGRPREKGSRSSDRCRQEEREEEGRSCSNNDLMEDHTDEGLDSSRCSHQSEGEEVISSCNSQKEEGGRNSSRRNF